MAASVRCPKKDNLLHGVLPLYLKSLYGELSLIGFGLMLPNVPDPLLS